MKSDFFDYFTYKIILSIPISFIANSVYSIMLFAALLASNTHGYNSTLNMGYFIFIMLMYIKAVFPFMIFNLFR